MVEKILSFITNNSKLISDCIKVLSGIIPAIVSLICLCKNKIKAQRWKAIQVIVKDAMVVVEEYSNRKVRLSSQQKLAMAIEATEIGMKVQKIKYDSSTIEQITTYITEMCAFSKTIN